jgi:hypothetical protein
MLSCKILKIFWTFSNRLISWNLYWILKVIQRYIMIKFEDTWYNQEETYRILKGIKLYILFGRQWRKPASSYIASRRMKPFMAISEVSYSIEFHAKLYAIIFMYEMSYKTFENYKYVFRCNGSATDRIACIQTTITRKSDCTTKYS